MTRSDKIHKLCNAIKLYRGRYHSRTGKWIDAPKLKEHWRIGRWLRELKLNVPECLRRVDGFKSMEEFNAWVKTI